MNLKEVYIFLGPPGAGKGSISQLCIQNLGWMQLSTGALCRKHIAQGTEIGKQIDFAIKSGRLIADSLIIEMVNEWLKSIKNHANAIILDGFPRTVMQAQALDLLLQEKFADFTLKVVRFSLADEIIIQRLTSRSVCQNQDCQTVYSVIEGSALAPKRAMTCDVCSSPLMRRLDDEVNAIVERLITHHNHENGLLNYYENNGRTVHTIAVARSLTEIFDEFKQLFRC